MKKYPSDLEIGDPILVLNEVKIFASLDRSPRPNYTWAAAVIVFTDGSRITCDLDEPVEIAQIK